MIESLSPLAWDVVGLNLEDAFVDYTRGPRRSLPVFGEETADGPAEHQRSRSRMIMIARKFSLLRQLAWAATLATGFGTLWFMLVVWLGTSIQRGLAGRGIGSLSKRLVVRSDGTPLIQSIPHDNLSLDDLSRPERPCAGRSGQRRPAPGGVSWPASTRHRASSPAVGLGAEAQGLCE